MSNNISSASSGVVAIEKARNVNSSDEITTSDQLQIQLLPSSITNQDLNNSLINAANSGTTKSNQVRDYTLAANISSLKASPELLEVGCEMSDIRESEEGLDTVDIEEANGINVFDERVAKH